MWKLIIIIITKIKITYCQLSYYLHCMYPLIIIRVPLTTNLFKPSATVQIWFPLYKLRYKRFSFSLNWSGKEIKIVKLLQQPQDGSLNCYLGIAKLIYKGCRVLGLVSCLKFSSFFSSWNNHIVFKKMKKQATVQYIYFVEKKGIFDFKLFLLEFFMVTIIRCICRFFITMEMQNLHFPVIVVDFFFF